MTIRSYCQGDPITVRAHVSAREAARTMVREGVGTLVVTSGSSPVGIVTDRDIVVRVLARGRDPEAVDVGSLMREPLVTVRDTDSIGQVCQAMRVHHVRRLPVVDRRGNLVGIVSADDLLVLVGREVEALGVMLSAQSPGASPAES